MTKYSKFLDNLLVDELRTAFLSGRSAFMLSADLRFVLWANGSGCRFLGYPTVNEALGRRVHLSAADRDKIIFGLECGKVTQLQIAIATADFKVRTVALPHTAGLLFEAIDNHSSQANNSGIIDGLGDQANYAAIITEQGDVLSYSRGFNDYLPLITSLISRLGDKRLDKHLLSFYDIQLLFGFVRLSERPKIFLALVMRIGTDARERSSGNINSTNNNLVVNQPNPTASEECRQLRDHARNQELDNMASLSACSAIKERADQNTAVKSDLNGEEKIAFREIAARLRSNLARADPVDNNRKLAPEDRQQMNGNSAQRHIAPSHLSAPADIASATLADLKNLFDIAANGLLLLDHSGRVSEASEGALALFAKARDEIIGQPFPLLFAANSKGIIEDYLATVQQSSFQSVLKSGREVAVTSTDGQEFCVYLTLIALESGQGVGAIINDVSARNNETSQLLEQLFDQPTNVSLTRHIAHELRTPLNAIVGFAEIISEQHFGPLGSAKYVQYARDILLSAQHIMATINNTLGGRPLNLHDNKGDIADIAQDVDYCISLMRDQANRNGIILRASIAPHVKQVDINRQVFRQILLNLLANAVRFTPSGGQIVLSAHHEGVDTVLLRVADTGCGMTETEIERAFEPYGQNARRDGRRGDLAFQGTGLGLTIAKALVEAQGGRLSLTSIPGSGTIVNLALPATNTPRHLER